MALDTILVAVGRGGDEATRMDRVGQAVADLAGASDANVVLLHVFDEDALADLIDQLDFDAPGDADADAVARRHSATRRLGDVLEAAGIGYDVRGAVGDDHGATVVSIADEIGADQIVVGGRSRSPAGKAVFGSVSQEILRSANCPVTYVRIE